MNLTYENSADQNISSVNIETSTSANQIVEETEFFSAVLIFNFLIARSAPAGSLTNQVRDAVLINVNDFLADSTGTFTSIYLLDTSGITTASSSSENREIIEISPNSVVITVFNSSGAVQLTNSTVLGFTFDIQPGAPAVVTISPNPT